MNKYKMTRNDALKMIKEKGGEFYVEFDQDVNEYGVFHTSSSFCWLTGDKVICEEEKKRLSERFNHE